jgi:sucrose-6-phosphate hydrolase SacC (GH32 family)
MKKSNLHLVLAVIALSLAVGCLNHRAGAAGNRDLRIADKTLVAWVYPADLTNRGGSVLTLENSEEEFDAIVFGEIEKGRWMAGSDHFRRTKRDQDNWPAETAGPDTLVQIAIVYDGMRVSIYRNGRPYAAYAMEDDPVEFDRDAIILMGLRHLRGDGFFEGAIEDARIYDTALSAGAIRSLKPNVYSDPEPAAWWSFEDGDVRDRMGTFGGTYLAGGARVAEGKLHLDKGSYMVAGKQRSVSAMVVGADTIQRNRWFRERLLLDPHRPGYHFVIPEGIGSPFDPNGAIFWKGRYHLFYIFQDDRGHCWGHVSSTDLVHWRHHPTGLYPGPGDPDRGMFSGNCFINKNGEPTMLYHGVDAGNSIATSSEDLLDNWNKLPGNPIVPNTPEGEDPRQPGSVPYASWDPHGWLEGDTYYAIFGGTRPAIFKAKTLDDWEYVGDVLAHAVEGVDINEDISCPDLFKLGDKYMLMCISHDMGCRYYIGEWKNEQFYPESHAQMSWVDNDFFAPESLEDDNGRRVMWAWIFDGRRRAARRASGWSGTMSLPRVLWLAEDKTMRMRPVEELEMLRYNGQSLANIALQADTELTLEGIRGNSLELLLEIDPQGAEQVGVKVCCSPDGEEQTAVYYDASDKKLKIDTRKSSLGEGAKKIEGGPFELRADEPLKIQIFVDKSVVEVFANDRQAVMRRIYPTRDDSLNVILFANGGPATVRSLRAWDIMPSNPY